MDQHKFLNLLRIFIVLPSLVLAIEPYEHFKNFCHIGERVPGTLGHRTARDFIVRSLHLPKVDSFFLYDTWFYNIYKEFPGENLRIALATHWDSDPGCPGANDGGSSVALLLSLADTLEHNPPPVAIDLLFFDGEDFGQAELLGSKHFASACIYNYSFIIVFDMIGDKNLQIFKEGNSADFFPQLVDSIWEIGREVAPAVFSQKTKYYIVDDHISLIKYGYRAIDVIDFDYSYWHTKDDTIDKCSKKSLDLMFKFVLHLVYSNYIY